MYITTEVFGTLVFNTSSLITCDVFPSWWINDSFFSCFHQLLLQDTRRWWYSCFITAIRVLHPRIFNNEKWTLLDSTSLPHARQKYYKTSAFKGTKPKKCLLRLLGRSWKPKLCSPSVANTIISRETQWKGHYTWLNLVSAQTKQTATNFITTNRTPIKKEKETE